MLHLPHHIFYSVLKHPVNYLIVPRITTQYMVAYPCCRRFSIQGQRLNKLFVCDTSDLVPNFTPLKYAVSYKNIFYKSAQFASFTRRLIMDLKFLLNPSTVACREHLIGPVFLGANDESSYESDDECESVFSLSSPDECPLTPCTSPCSSRDSSESPPAREFLPALKRSLLEFESIRVAKKRHYNPQHTALEIQRRTGSRRLQGRPRTNELECHFLLHTLMEELFCSLANIQCAKFLDLLGEFPYTMSTRKFKSLGEAPVGRQIKFCGEKPHKTDTWQINQRMDPRYIKQVSQGKPQDVYLGLCKIFGSQFTFVKIIRNTECKVLKMETIAPGDMPSYLENTEPSQVAFCSPQWVKKNIAYPRYKKGMRIHLLQGSHHFILYNDPKLFHWDTAQGIVAKEITTKSVYLNTTTSLSLYLDVLA